MFLVNKKFGRQHYTEDMKDLLIATFIAHYAYAILYEQKESAYQSRKEMCPAIQTELWSKYPSIFGRYEKCDPELLRRHYSYFMAEYEKPTDQSLLKSEGLKSNAKKKSPRTVAAAKEVDAPIKRLRLSYENIAIELTEYRRLTYAAGNEDIWEHLISMIDKSTTTLHLSDGMNTIDLVAELKRFIILKAYAKDYHGSLLSPSNIIDQVWQMLLLFPRKYARLCLVLSGTAVKQGYIIDYNPRSTKNDDNEKEEKLVRTKELYERFYDAKAPSLYWDDAAETEIVHQLSSVDLPKETQLPSDDFKDEFVTIIFRSHFSKDDVWYRVKDTTIIGTLMENYGTVKGIPNTLLRFVLDGETLTSNESIAELCLENNDYIYVQLLKQPKNEETSSRTDPQHPSNSSLCPL